MGVVPSRPSARARALSRSQVLLHRYSIDITAIAHESLGDHAIDNRTIQLLLSIYQSPGQTPSQLAEVAGASRSAVSRSISSLTERGLVSRRRAEDDRRSVTLQVTPRGRRRIEHFASRLGDYFEDGAPLVKEALHDLRKDLPARGPVQPISPLDAAIRMSTAGAAYVDAVSVVLEPYRITHAVERWTLALIFERGVVRPSQLADELGLTSSSVSTLLNRLEDRGLILRRHDEVAGDRRAVVVVLTPEGEAAAGQLLAVFARHVDATLDALQLTLGAVEVFRSKQ